MPQQSLDLGGKDQFAANLRVVQRFHPELIVDQHQLALGAVPNGEGVFSVEPTKEYRPLVEKSPDEDFHLAIPPEAYTSGFQGLAVHFGLVDFSVHDC